MSKRQNVCYLPTKEEKNIEDFRLIEDFNKWFKENVHRERRVNFQIYANCTDLCRIPYDDITLNITDHQVVSKLANEFFESKKEEYGKNCFALRVACRYNWFHVVEGLLQNEISVDNDKADEDSPLIIAAFYNFTSIVKLLINNGADVSKVASNKRTALHFAAQHGNEELCKILLAHAHYETEGGGNVDETDITGKTPLHLAMLASRKGKMVASLLLKKGANITVKDAKDCGCALTMAAGEGAHEIIEMLLRSVPHEKRKSIQREIDEALFIAVQIGDAKSVKTLLDQGASVSARKKGGQLTPLHVAAINGHDHIVKVLLSSEEEGKSLPFSRDHRDMTPFHRACLNGHKRIVEMEDIWEDDMYTDVDANGNTALMLAILNGRLKVVQYILQSKKHLVNIKAKDKKDHNILHKAVESKGKEMLKKIFELAPDSKDLIIQKDNYNCTPVLHAACYEDASLIEILKENTEDIFHVDGKTQTALHIAAKYGNDNVISCLLQDYLNDPSAAAEKLKMKDKNGFTALHYAASQGRVDAIKAILAYCNDSTVINALNNKGETPLHLACRENKEDCVRELLKKDADITITDKFEDFTCLDQAAAAYNDNICTILIKSSRNNKNHLWSEESNPICNMEIMIEKYPSVAKEILDECQRVDGDDITYLFSILDVKDRKNQSSFKFLPALMNSDIRSEHLITHNVTKKLIFRKWNRFGRWIHLVWFLLNAIYTSFLTALVVTAKFDEKKARSQIQHPANLTNLTCLISRSGTHYEAFPWVILIMGVIYLTSQILYVVHMKFDYFTPSNVLKLLIKLLTFIFILPIVACNFDQMKSWLEARGLEGKLDLQWQFGALAILLSWVNLLFHFKHLFYGIYVEMLTEVLKSWLKVIAVFIILIIGFALSFHCILDQKELQAFKHPGIAIIKTVVWMIGEVNYDDAFIDAKLKYFKVSIVILIVFFIVMNITFINLLVGLAVGDIDAVQKRAFLILLKEKISALEILHKTLPSFFRRSMYERTFVYKKNDSIFSKIMDKFGNNMVQKTEKDYNDATGGQGGSLINKKASWRRGAVQKTNTSRVNHVV